MKPISIARAQVSPIHPPTFPKKASITVWLLITAVPALRAVTLPFSTFATVASLDFHVTALFVAFEGATVAVSVIFSVSFIYIFLLLSSSR